MADNKGGRPSSRTLSPQQLLDAYERHAAAQHRSRKPVSKESFCHAIGRTKPTLNNYLTAFGLLWPLVPPGRLVVLCEAQYPCELLWVSRSLDEALHYERGALIDRTWREAFKPDESPSAEMLMRIDQLRRGCAEAYDALNTHLEAADGRWLDCHVHFRYGPESDTFYSVIEPLSELHAPPLEEVEVLDVEPDVRWVMHPVRDGSSRVVRLDSLQDLLEMLEERRQTDS
jgi:hypothetical protein